MDVFESLGSQICFLHGSTWELPLSIKVGASSASDQLNLPRPHLVGYAPITHKSPPAPTAISFQALHRHHANKYGRHILFIWKLVGLLPIGGVCTSMEVNVLLAYTGSGWPSGVPMVGTMVVNDTRVDIV